MFNREWNYTVLIGLLYGGLIANTWATDCVFSIVESPADQQKLKLLEKNISKVKGWLKTDQKPSVNGKDAIAHVEDAVVGVFDLASFLPRKLFEYTLLVGGWSLLSLEAKKEKVKLSIIEGVLENESIAEELAPGYKSCIANLLEGLAESVCDELLKNLDRIAQEYVDHNVKDFDILTFGKIAKMEKTVRVVLLSEIASKNIKEKLFSPGKTLNFSEKIHLDIAKSSVIYDYTTCLLNTINYDDVESCDSKISVSIPYRIGKEILDIKLRQLVACKYTHNDFEKIKLKSDQEFDSCTAKTYLAPINKNKQLRKIGKEVKLPESPEVIKACVFSSVLELVGNLADREVKLAVSSELKGVKIPKEIDFSGRKSINSCLRGKGLINKKSEEFNYSSLRIMDSESLKTEILKCSDDVKLSTGANIARLLLAENKYFKKAFKGKEKEAVIKDVNINSFNKCIKLYDEIEPSLCAGQVKQYAAKKIIEKILFKKALEKVSGNEKLASEMFLSTKKSLNKCMDLLISKSIKKVLRKEALIRKNNICTQEEAKTCFDSKSSTEDCDSHKTVFDEEGSALCLNKSIGIMSEELSSYIIKSKVKSNKELQKLGIDLSKKELEILTNVSSQCFKTLLKCSTNEIRKNASNEIEDINCIRKSETLSSLEIKAEVITERCENQVYRTVLPMVAKKKIMQSLDLELTDHKIISAKRKLSFLKSKGKSSDEKEILRLSIQITRWEKELSKLKNKIADKLEEDFYDDIKNILGLGNMKKKVPKLESEATFQILGAVVDDSIEEYLTTTGVNKAHDKLKSKIKNEILGEEFKLKLLETGTEKERDAIVRNVKKDLILNIGVQVIDDTVKSEAPSDLDRKYVLKVSEHLQKGFSSCINNNPDGKKICSNIATRVGTGRIFLKALEKEANELLENDNNSFLTNTLEKLNESQVRGLLKKSRIHATDCLTGLDISIDAETFSEQSLSCTSLAILNFSENAIDEYLDIYDSALPQYRRAGIRAFHRACLKGIKEKALSKSFPFERYSEEKAVEAFGRNEDTGVTWVTGMVESCSDKFKINMRKSLLLRVLEVFNGTEFRDVKF